MGDVYCLYYTSLFSTVACMAFLIKIQDVFIKSR